MTSHGGARHDKNGKQSKIYITWKNMLNRCCNQSHPQYEEYGGRGIKVCKRWLDFKNFLTDMGEKPEGLTLERIDNDGNYEPSNCKWGTRSEQSSNQRTRRNTGKGNIHHCPICGRFMKHQKNRYDDLEWICPKLTYDEYLGAWDHW